MTNPLTDEWTDVFNTLQSPLKECCIYAYPELIRRLQDSLDKAENALLEQAREQKNDKDKEALILAMHVCQEQKNDVVQMFATLLAERFQELSPCNKQALANKSLNKADISTQITLQKLNTDAVRHFHQYIDNIQNALHHNLNAEEILFFENPFTPKQIIDCYFQSLTRLSVETQALLPLLQHFQSEFLFHLNDFYKSLNTQLQPFTAPANPWGMDVKPTNNSTDKTFQLDLVQSEPAHTEKTIYPIDQRAQGENSIVPSTSEDASFLQGMGFAISSHTPESSVVNDNILSRQALMDLLREHQKAYDPRSDGTLIDFVNRLIDDERISQKCMHLRQQEQNILNLTALIFDQISLALSERGRDLFNRLKAPYARLALENEVFFTDQSNAARQLLDEIIAFNQQHQDEKIFLHQLKLSVSKIILRFKDDHTVFSEQLQFWKTLNQKKINETVVQVKSTSTQTPAKYDDEAIQQMIENQCQVLPHQLPFHIFTQQIWHNILSTIIQQRGPSSSHWQTALLLLDKTLQISGFFQQKTLAKQAEQLPILHEKIHKLFVVYKISEMKREIFFSQLESIERQLIEGKKLIDIAEDKLPQADFLSALIQPVNDTCN